MSDRSSQCSIDLLELLENNCPDAQEGRHHGFTVGGDGGGQAGGG